MGRELKLWIGASVLTVVLAVVGTGVAVATLVVGNVTTQISDVRADLRQIRDRVDRLDRLCFWANWPRMDRHWRGVA